MAIVTNGAGQTSVVTQEAASLVYYLCRHLIDNTSWTLYGSGNGVATGGPGVDASSISYLANTNAWIAVTSPDGTLQILFDMQSNTLALRIYLNLFGDYSGGTATVMPTSAGHGGGNGASIFNTNISDALTKRIHITADDSPSGVPGWALYEHQQGAFATSTAGLCLVPLLNGDPGDTRPWVVGCFGSAGTTPFTVASTAAEGAGDFTNGFSGVRPGTTTVIGYPAQITRTGTSDVFPLGQGSDSAGNDMLLPVVFGRRAALASPGYKGHSAGFCRWVSQARTQMSTYANRTWINFNVLAFPWDGTSTPTST